MSVPMCEDHNEYVGIFEVGKQYWTIYIGESEVFFIGEVEKDKKVARLAAQSFAKERKLSYHDELVFYSDSPIITIVQYKSRWYPAEIYPETNTTNLIEDIVSLDPLDMAGSKRGAIYYAHHIAIQEKRFLVPAVNDSFTILKCLQIWKKNSFTVD